MNAEQLNAIKERAEKATQGPWYADMGDVYAEEISKVAEVLPNNQFADMEFIAYARQDIPQLLAEVERLRGALKSVQGELIWTRGRSVKHDGAITGMCVKIRKVLDGGEYDE